MADLERLFNPRSVAVIGASNSPEKIGNAIMVNLKQGGYPGKVFPVNPKETQIEGFPCYPTVEDVPEEIDVAVVSVPAARVIDVAEQCGNKKVKFLVVITAGFKEVGREGAELERKLRNIAAEHGMRIVGPNCLGIIDTHVPINATFAKGSPLRGKIAFISQSGALCIAILDWSKKRGLGFSQFVSLGNKADLNEADFIEHASKDPNTKVILCYLEDVANGERFISVAREASGRVPVVVLKVGISQAGAQAASSHTGALAGSDLAYDVAFRHARVIRARTMTDLFDLAVAFASQPLPKDESVAIITNSGGPGIVATDSVEAEGLKMVRFSKNTIENLRAHLPPTSNVYNPVDVIGDAGPERYRHALDNVLSDPAVSAAVVLLTPTAVVHPEETAKVVVEMRNKYRDKPLLASFMGGEEVRSASNLLEESGIPCYPFPEAAVRAMAALARYSSALKAEVSEDRPLKLGDINRGAVSEIFEDVAKDGRSILLGPEAARVARAYGIPVAASLLATKPDEAAYMAELIGFPVVLKVASPNIMHKTDVGGVKVGLSSARQVRKGFLDIVEKVQTLMPGAHVYGVEVQKMMPKGTELIVGMTRDIQFGPLIAFGLGGIYVNLMKDVSFRLAKGLTRREAEAMIYETKAAALLKGFRGQKQADIKAIVDILLRVAKLVLDFPNIVELDMNPVVAYDKGAAVLDAKISIEPRAAKAAR